MQTNNDLIFFVCGGEGGQLATSALCGTQWGLNRWKDGTGSYLVALCLSDQKARLPICSPNWTCNLAFFKSQSSNARWRGKVAAAATLSSLPCSLLISSVQALMSQKKKGKKERKEEPAWYFIPQTAVPFQKGTHGTTKVSVPQVNRKHGPFPSESQHACNLLRFIQTLWVWFSVLHPARQQARSRGFGQLLWQKLLNSSSWFQIFIPFWVSAEQSSQNPPPNLQFHKLLKEGVWECASYPGSNLESWRVERASRNTPPGFSPIQCAWEMPQVHLEMFNKYGISQDYNNQKI